MICQTLGFVLFLVIFAWADYLVDLQDSQSIFPGWIMNDEDCQNFVETEHQFGRIPVEVSIIQKAYRIGNNITMDRCLELVHTEGKIVLMMFSSSVPPAIVRSIANDTGIRNVWLLFSVALGPNCERVPDFNKQWISPFNHTVIEFCESEYGPQRGYTFENVNNFVASIKQFQENGTYYATLNARLLLHSTNLTNWNLFKRWAKRIIVRQESGPVHRSAVLKALDTNESKIIWEDKDKDRASGLGNNWVVLGVAMVLFMVQC